MKPAARLGDMHTCPLATPGTPPIPHVGGPIMPPCYPPVMVGNQPAARVGDMCICVGPPDAIVEGSMGVLIGNQFAARIGDATAHGGVITAGLPSVLIGKTGGGGHGLASAVAGVNPANSTINCDNIIDAAAARLNGSDPDAAAPAGQDGTFPQIEQRFGTTLTWGSDFQSAFDAVRAGGDGTMAVVGIGYSGGRGSHVVLLANDGGSVGIVEGQDWGAGNPPEAITDVNRANTRYNSDGGSNIGWGIVPPRP